MARKFFFPGQTWWWNETCLQDLHTNYLYKCDYYENRVFSYKLFGNVVLPSIFFSILIERWITLHIANVFFQFFIRFCSTTEYSRTWTVLTGSRVEFLEFWEATSPFLGTVRNKWTNKILFVFFRFILQIGWIVDHSNNDMFHSEILRKSANYRTNWFRDISIWRWFYPRCYAHIVALSYCSMLRWHSPNVVEAQFSFNKQLILLHQCDRE